MSTRSAVGIMEGEQFRGRYVHFDGYPSARIPALRAALASVGGDCQKLVDTLIHEHYGWSSLSGDVHIEMSESRYHDGRFEAVPGVGIAYTDTEINGYQQTTADEWLTWPGTIDPLWTEWAYAIDPNTSTVLVFKGKWVSDEEPGDLVPIERVNLLTVTDEEAERIEERGHAVCC